jgi:hypothetical protein
MQQEKKATFSDHSIDGFIHCSFVESSIVSINPEVWAVELQDFILYIFRFPSINVDIFLFSFGKHPLGHLGFAKVFAFAKAVLW